MHPPWVRITKLGKDCIQECFFRVKLFHDYASWDEAFGLPHPKDQKQSAKRAEFSKRARLWVRVAELRRDAPHRDHFPTVAKEFGLSVAVAKKYFYAANKLTGCADEAEALAMLERMAASLTQTRSEQAARLNDAAKRRDELTEATDPSTNLAE